MCQIETWFFYEWQMGRFQIYIEMLSKKLEEVKNLKWKNPSVSLSKNQAKFLSDLIESLKQAIKNGNFNEKNFLNDFKLSLSGDIFYGNYFR